LLKKSKKKTKSLKTKASSLKSKGKKEGENSTSEHSDSNENNFGYENPESSSSEEPEDSEDNHVKKMNELEKCLEAISIRSNLQEVGVVRPHPVECDSAPYPPRFKAPNLYAFDDKGSLNQHIYYFKSQTGNVVSNDAIMAHLFIDTFKGVTFECFMKLPAGSIKEWTDL